MLLRFTLLLLLCISGTSNAPNPNCSSNSFCYNPTDSQKIILTKDGENLKLKLFDEKSEIQKLQLVQKNGKSVEIDCSAESGNSKNEENGAKSCEVNLKADQFEKNSKFPNFQKSKKSSRISPSPSISLIPNLPTPSP
ncbi:hypothetical protein B9Z55_004503 [Caenorhabditis nigoni]|uniref:Phlebovirus glycoprotein G2 fusion domain-containing protein n=1 Tax=Caenorhabditis nigoni TaxID=1611254 RepID=A0A2G5UWV1_9PELO|nr:hypothetical protein B9Z55_004503 [Caenorhabditis nigoni]